MLGHNHLLLPRVYILWLVPCCRIVTPAVRSTTSRSSGRTFLGLRRIAAIRLSRFAILTRPCSPY